MHKFIFASRVSDMVVKSPPESVEPELFADLSPPFWFFPTSTSSSSSESYSSNKQLLRANLKPRKNYAHTCPRPPFPPFLRLVNQSREAREVARALPAQGETVEYDEVKERL